MDSLIKFPIKAKTKAGSDIKKLPPAYPIIGEYEKEFKDNYTNTLKEKFLNKLNDIFKEDEK